MAKRSYSEEITAAVLSWPGTEAAPHRFGGVEYRLGRRELGHLHGNEIADLPLPRKLRDELIASGRGRVHRFVPDSGWVTIPLSDQSAVDDVIDLLHDAYERAKRARKRAATPA
jgi:Luciferase